MKGILTSNIQKAKRYIKENRRRKIAAAYYREHEALRPGNYYSTNCFDYYKCIFIHIPKTAGLSVSKSLFGNYAGGHLSYDSYVKKFGKATVDNYFKFTFVRNPWERLASAYFFLKKGGMNSADAAFAKKYLSSVNNFESFVNDWLSEDNLDLYYHIIPQYKYITSNNAERIMVDFVGKYENLQDDFRRICNSIFHTEKLLLDINSTEASKIKYKTLYTEDMKKKVAVLYAMDIQMFGYAF
ncbi:sulfotransferase family protein [Panacibacter ginsenosidivorans]|uniref:Sulfotransferase family protein n=1 Tax=Panacibacter ginsenosidivorans TaxID=1813871 RepID=A0A5B8VC47_9BACT|nr:sulfotransferase family 2 domain-containing protein [Panacibacter ginsenosidivorans]QEC69080.1 sulfotransferase family protein [Panacibacter ginsenosidivorans]